MWVEEFESRNFRNLEGSALQPGRKLNVIWGDNGQGKTNFLEGLYLFTHFKSFRGAANSDLLGPDGDQGRIRLRTNCGDLTHTMSLTITANGREFLLNGKLPRPMVRMLDGLRAILFSPEELLSLRTFPAARRALLDRAIFQLDPLYLGKAVEYERVLRQRNRLLRDRVSGIELRAWDDALVKSGAIVRHARIAFLRAFTPLLIEAHRHLSEQEESIALDYPGDPGADHATLEEEMRRELRQQSAREERLKQSCVGPHRDDPHFFIDGTSARHHASQGEWRTMILSFKTALLRRLHAELGTPPLFLLDDMAAELDRDRQKRLFKLLAESGAQVFITTTDPSLSQAYGEGEVHYFHMKSGRIVGQTA